MSEKVIGFMFLYKLLMWKLNFFRCMNKLFTCHLTTFENVKIINASNIYKCVCYSVNLWMQDVKRIEIQLWHLRWEFFSISVGFEWQFWRRNFILPKKMREEKFTSIWGYPVLDWPPSRRRYKIQCKKRMSFHI